MHASAAARSLRPIVTTSREGRGTSQSAASVKGSGESMVRFVNVMPVSASSTCCATDDAYHSQSCVRHAATKLPAANSDVVHTLRRSVLAADLASARLTLRDGGRYALIACADRDGKVRLLTVDDEIISGVAMARVRVSHAASGFLRATIAMTGQPVLLFEKTNYGGAPRSADVDSMTAGIMVRIDGHGKALLTLRSMALRAGSAQAFVLASRMRRERSSIAFADMSSAPLARESMLQCGDIGELARCATTPLFRRSDVVVQVTSDLADETQGSSVEGADDPAFETSALFMFWPSFDAMRGHGRHDDRVSHARTVRRRAGRAP